MAANKKQTSPGIASLAAATLTNKASSHIAKQLAASALSQKAVSKQTGSALEEKAGKVLRSEKYSADTKKLAASVLAQANKER